MYTLSCTPQLPLKITSYHHLAVSKPWTHLKLLEDGHLKNSWFSFETLRLWAPLAEWEVIQMCCSTAPFQVPWMCSVEFCLIFSTFPVPASAAVNFWSIFHHRKWCCLQLWFDLCSCQTEASIESPKSVQFLLVLETGKAANSASGSTFPSTPSSSVIPYLQTSSTSEIEQDMWGNGRMVTVTSKRSSGCLSYFNHQSTNHHWVAAGDLKLGLLQFIALCQLATWLSVALRHHWLP